MGPMMKTTLIATVLALPCLAGAAPASPEAPHAATRAEVREALHQARITGRMSPGGEIADPPEVLRAREEFNALQAEVLQDPPQASAARDELAERD